MKFSEVIFFIDSFFKDKDYTWIKIKYLASLDAKTIFISYYLPVILYIFCCYAVYSLITFQLDIEILVMLIYITFIYIVFLMLFKKIAFYVTEFWVSEQLAENLNKLVYLSGLNFLVFIPWILIPKIGIITLGFAFLFQNILIYNGTTKLLYLSQDVIIYWFACIYIVFGFLCSILFFIYTLFS